MPTPIHSSITGKNICIHLVATLVESFYKQYFVYFLQVKYF
jgi:hypothetical protein